MKRQIIIEVLPHTSKDLLPTLSAKKTAMKVAITLTTPTVAVVVSGVMPRSNKSICKEYSQYLR